MHVSATLARMRDTLLALVLVTLATTGSTTGCGGSASSNSIEAVRQRAAFDLDCDQQIVVREIGHETYGATACGRRASYVTICNGFGNNCRAVMNSEERPAEGRTEPTGTR